MAAKVARPKSMKKLKKPTRTRTSSKKSSKHSKTVLKKPSATKKTKHVKKGTISKKGSSYGGDIGASQSRREWLKSFIISLTSTIAGAKVGANLSYAMVESERHNENEIIDRLRVEMETLKKNNLTLYPVGRKMADILRIIGRATVKLDILGINALGPLHQGIEEIRRVLNNGGQVRILLLDHTSKAFRKREQRECARITDGVSSHRLTKEWEASVEIIRDLNLMKTRGILELRTHDKYPKCALIISDEKEVQYNKYPTVRKKIPSEAVLPRGVSGDTVIFTFDQNISDFRKHISYFEDLWKPAKKYRLS